MKFNFIRLSLWSNYFWFYLVICYSGLILLLSASSIILSLIPVYISQHDASLNIVQEQSPLFYVEYTAMAIENRTVAYVGFADNLADVTKQITQQLGLRSNIINIKQIELIEQTESNYRREEIKNGKNLRIKREVKSRLLLSCQVKYKSECRSNGCRIIYLSKLQQQYSKHSDILLSLRLISLSDQTFQFNLHYVNFTFNIPQGFTIVYSTSNSNDEWESIVNPVTFSLTAVKRLLNDGGYAIISAERNPSISSDVSLTDTVIQQRTANLIADLTKISLYTSIFGMYDGSNETSLFIILHNTSPDEERTRIMKLGEKYNQDSIIYVQRTKPTIQQLIYTTGQFKGAYIQGQGYSEFTGNVTDNYSRLSICPNSSYTFSLNFNFETMITKTTVIRTRLLINHHIMNRLINQKRLNF